MATLAIKTARQRIATALEALSGWRESTIPGELFPRETSDVEHKSFAVWSPTSTWSDVEQGRRRRPSGSLTESILIVRWTWRLRLDAAVADLDAATDAEQQLLQTVLAVSAVDLHLGVESAQRIVAEGNASGAYVIGELRFAAGHLYDQTA